MVLGRVDYGGDSQRGWVRWNLPGKACEWVRDWDAIDGLESLPAAKYGVWTWLSPPGMVR